MGKSAIFPAMVLAALCLPGSVVADDDEMPLPIVRDRQGRILTPGDASPAADAKPDRQEPEETAAEPEIISLEAAIEAREALKPLKKRLNTRGIRNAEVEYLEALRLWAVRQDDRLKEYRNVHAAYEKLKDYRDGAAAKGDNTSRIDPRLEGMEKKLAAMSEGIRTANAELEEITMRQEAQLQRMPQTIAAQHEIAMAVIKQARGESSGSGNHP